MNERPNHPAFHKKTGFTLVETLFALTLSIVVGGIVASCMIALMQGVQRLGGYSDMNNVSHRSLELMARDIRMAIDVKEASDHHFVIDVQEFRNQEFIKSEIRYEYNKNEGVLERNEVPFMTGITDCSFRYFRLRPNHDYGEEELTDKVMDSLREVKEIQVQATMEREYMVRRIVVTNQIVSARFMMRNRIVAMP